MRPKSLKFHAIAIGLICLIVTALYFLVGPTNPGPLDPNAPSGDRFVRIINASWGLNCNTEISRLRAQGVLASGKLPLKPVEPNNATYAVSDRCSNKLACSFLATNDLLDTDPLPSCFKQLVVNYRCFEFDRQWRKQVDQGDKLSIDCNASADKDRK